MYSDEYNNEEMIQNSEETSNIDNNSSSSNKKVLWIVIAAIVLVLIVILYLWLGSGDKPDNPKPIIPQITISSQKENLSLGNSIPLKAIVTNIENAPIIWTSSNEAVATVDNAGNVTGINEGMAIITATYFHTDGVPYSLSCEITVLKGDPNITLTNVSFPEGELLISEGAEHQIQVVIEPPEAYAGDIKYSSADDTIATIDQDGKIKAIKEGETEIRLNAKDGDFTDQITVNVTKEQVDAQIIIPISSIEFDKPLLKLEVGSNPQQLSYKILPENALRNDLTWVSSDPTVASVNQGGVVSPLKVGTTEITVKSLDGEFATMTVEVIEKNVPVTGIEILNNSKDDPNYTEKTKTFNLKVNETAQIFASVKPDNATNKEITYSSDKESVATVDEDGFITAISKGTAKITIVSKENVSAKDEITVNVTTGGTGTGSSPGGSSSSISLSDITIKPGETREVKITGLKETEKVSRCYVGNNSYASVDVSNISNNECKITAKSTGKTTFTVVLNTGASKTVNLTINGEIVSVTSVSLNTESLKLCEGDVATLIARVYPSNATDKSLSWESSKDSVATVDNNGKVTAKGVGSATITVKTADGKHSAKCTVTVVKEETNLVPVKSISITPSTKTMTVGDVFTFEYDIEPNDATDFDLEWGSSDLFYVDITRYGGKVTARKAAEEVEIWVIDNKSGKYATAKIKVNPLKITDFKMSYSNNNIEPNSSLTVDLEYDSRAEVEFECSTSNTNIATALMNGNKCVISSKNVEGFSRINVTINEKITEKTKNITLTVYDSGGSWSKEESRLDECQSISLDSCSSSGQCMQYVTCDPETVYYYTFNHKAGVYNSKDNKFTFATEELAQKHYDQVSKNYSGPNSFSTHPHTVYKKTTYSWGLG